MIFTIQTYIEEYFNNRSISDTDGFAVKLANLYFHEREHLTYEELVSKASRIRTVIYKKNNIDDKSLFLNTLFGRLDRLFKKKLLQGNPSFPGGIKEERQRISGREKITIDVIINEFCGATEARAIDAFWVSRKRGKLRDRPEKIAQSLLAIFIKGVLRDSGIILREFLSGIGFVDIGVVISTTLHLIEIKIVSNDFSGPSQLNEYMKTEGRTKGNLVLFDPLPNGNKIEVPDKIEVESGIIYTYVVNINPIIPSQA